MRATRRLMISVLLIALLGCKAVPGARPPAHVPRLEAFCFVCLKPINGDGGVRAFLSHGFERQYRCIHCAMLDLRDSPAPVTLRVHTVVSNTRIEFKLGPGEWTAHPPAPVFLLLPERNGNCREAHQTFVDEEEYRSYLAAHPDLDGPAARLVPFSEYGERLRGQEWRP